MKKLFIFSSMIPILFLFSCYDTVNLRFNNNFKPQGKKIAVITGVRDDSSFQVVDCVTNTLSSNSKFEVIPQKEIMRLMPDYPQNIKGPYKGIRNIEDDENSMDISAIKKINNNLKADYLVIVWLGLKIHEIYGNSKAGTYTFYFRVFDTSSFKVIGESKLNLFFCIESCIGRFESDAYKELCETLSKQLIEKFGMAK